jgi:uncharacterized protein YodC (DUF2158 family)
VIPPLPLFKPDDLVRLKSGGPVMTMHHRIGQMHEPQIIETVDQALRLRGFSDGDLVCLWYEGLELRVEPFPVELLERVELPWA